MLETMPLRLVLSLLAMGSFAAYVYLALRVNRERHKRVQLAVGLVVLALGLVLAGLGALVFADVRSNAAGIFVVLGPLLGLPALGMVSVLVVLDAKARRKARAEARSRRSATAVAAWRKKRTQRGDSPPRDATQ